MIEKWWIMQKFAMGDSTVNYVVDAIRQMGVEYRDLRKQMSGLEHQLKLMLEENKQRDEDRRRFQKVVFEVLFRSNTASHIGSEGGVFGNEKLSSGDVKFDNSKGIDIDRDSVLLETNKSILKSGLLSAGNVDLHTSSSNCLYDKINSFISGSGISSCILKSEIIEEQSKWKGKLPQVEVVSAMKPPKFGRSPQFTSVGSKETDCLYIGRSGTGLVEIRMRRCTLNASHNASLDVSFSSKTCEKKRDRSKSSGSCSKMCGGNCQVLNYRVGPFKLTRKLNAPRDGEVLEYIFDESLPMSEYIVETVHNRIQRRMMLCLKLEGNVWGEVINAVWEILTEFETNMHHEERKNWFLSTRMTVHL
ncbi:hypothetical protein PanWU01x14_226320 [Parasponia andersonii]|uniref:Uncharacterized protein n=1 Tax=Parasponia andersonii TaxID=3476 RepID=A0A2P5BMG5_PARAD|nr:hypothetical protein PanWU01x14_226320 [Parasponia andersonii]